MTMPKTMQQIINEYPNLYNGTNVNSETQTMLNDYFYFRRVCDSDEKFIHFYQRNLKMYYPKYLIKLEAELKEMPDLDLEFYNAVHSIINSNGTTSGSVITNTTDNSTTNTSNSTSVETEGSSTANRTESSSSQSVTNDERHQSGTDSKNSTTEQLVTGKHISIDSDQNQGIVYPNASSDNMDVGSLDTSYVGVQRFNADNDGKHKTTDSGTNSLSEDGESTTTNTGSGTAEDSASTSSTQTGTQTGENVTSSTGQSTTTNTGSNLNNSNSNVVSSGRNTFETDLRRKVYDMASDCIAFRWLVERLQICFFSVYDLEE